MSATTEIGTTLYDSDTAETLGSATPEQIAASADAGPEGHIRIDSNTGAVIPESEQAAATRRGITLRRVYVAR